MRGSSFVPGLASACLATLMVSIGCGKEPAVLFDGPPRIEEISEGTFGGIGDQEVTLDEGRWEGEPYTPEGASRSTVGLVDHFALEGDMDGDGIDETAVLLWESSGGSGTRSYLAVTGRAGRKIENLGTALIGDRTQVIAGWIAENLVTLDLVRAGPTDAACCPSERAVVSWSLTAEGLTRFSEQVTGTLSLLDLEGPEWMLAELGRGNPIPDDVAITLQFQGDRVAGTGGCNRYFGSVESLAPGNLDFSGMGTTQMACPELAMGVERQFLTTLAGATGYGFFAGRLLIHCDTDDGPAALLFDLPLSLPDPPGATP